MCSALGNEQNRYGSSPYGAYRLMKVLSARGLSQIVGSKSLLFSREDKLVIITTNTVWWIYGCVYWEWGVISPRSRKGFSKNLMQVLDPDGRTRVSRHPGKQVLVERAAGCWGTQMWSIVLSLECRVLRPGVGGGERTGGQVMWGLVNHVLELGLYCEVCGGCWWM